MRPCSPATEDSPIVATIEIDRPADDVFANRPVTSELTHIDPPETWGVRGIDGPIRASVDVTVEPLPGEHARLAIAIDFTGHGIVKLLVALLEGPGVTRSQ